MSKEHLVLAWDDNPGGQSTPLLVIGEMLNGHPLEKGMEIIKLHYGNRYKLIDFVFRDERHEKNRHYDLTMAVLNADGTEGKQVRGYSVNGYLAVKKADIHVDQQELFFDRQKVEGEIKDGTFVPDAKYLINWAERFQNYFDIIKKHSPRDPKRDKTARLIMRTIEEIGVGMFNHFIRYHKERFPAFSELVNNMVASMYAGWFVEKDEKLSFAHWVLEYAMNEGDHFFDAVKAVVLEEGITIKFQP